MQWVGSSYIRKSFKKGGLTNIMDGTEGYQLFCLDESDPFSNIPTEEQPTSTSDPIQLVTDEETDPETEKDPDSADEYETGDPPSPAC